jgi:hypothetical protein
LAVALNLAKLLEGSEKRSLDSGLIAIELAERLSVLCIGVKGAPKTKLVAIPLKFGTPELSRRTGVRGFVRDRSFCAEVQRQQGAGTST